MRSLPHSLINWPRAPRPGPHAPFAGLPPYVSSAYPHQTTGCAPPLQTAEPARPPATIGSFESRRHVTSLKPPSVRAREGKSLSFPSPPFTSLPPSLPPYQVGLSSHPLPRCLSFSSFGLRSQEERVQARARARKLRLLPVLPLPTSPRSTIVSLFLTASYIRSRFARSADSSLSRPPFSSFSSFSSSSSSTSIPPLPLPIFFQLYPLSFLFSLTSRIVFLRSSSPSNLNPMASILVSHLSVR